MTHWIAMSMLWAYSAATTDGAVDAARRHRQEQGTRILAEFAELLRIPNTARDAVNIRKNAEHIRDLLIRRGVAAELLELEGAPPIVFGELRAPATKRTLGIYVHYDGQPVDKSKWTNPPYEPALYTEAIENGGVRRAFPAAGETIDPKWRIYARASGDDKAPIIALAAALDALRESNIALTSNLKFFFEGEEEAGSPHLGQFLEKYADKIDVDAWIICDGPAHQSRKPQLVFGVRGVTGLDITVYGATRVLHSGHYGNWAPNPAMMLARLLASMKDDDGRILVEGFYDTALPLNAAERAALADVPNIDDALRKELGLTRTEGGNAPMAERLLLPSLNVRGLTSASTGATARNIIPNRAEASIDIRLVKGNDPESMLDLVEAHIRKQGYTIVREEPDEETRLKHAKIALVRRRTGYRAARTSMSLPIVRQVIAAAQRATGGPLIRLPSLGGSLPLYLFTDNLKKPVIIAPIANHDDNQHAPDENIRISNLWYGIDLMAALFTMPAE